MTINPFFELYVGDRLSGIEFVKIFSPYLVEHAEAIFRPGNVVVTGVQGRGKSMLLSLLKPDVRMEYAKAGIDFPVRKEIGRFIGAGINLAHSNAIDFGYRQISSDPNQTALFFADFVNYAVLLDLFASLKCYAHGKNAGIRELGIDLSQSRQSKLVSSIASEDAFHETFAGCANIDEVEVRIRQRLNAYRRFLHLNDDNLGERIAETKTDIGVPVSAMVKLLKDTQVIASDVAIFIHVDQYEELANIASLQTNSPDYRRVINRALARRDPQVSYRIGTRGHAWRNHGFIFGSDAKLEEERDYKFVDLDSMLMRMENRKTWIFPKFAKDVFFRRLQYFRLGSNGVGKDALLESVFGKGLAPVEKARRYGGSNRARCVKVDESWPADFRAGLFALAKENPLLARLLEAWVLQQLARRGKVQASFSETDLSMEMLAEIEKRPWWKKERIELALTQIAGRCQQRPLWSGAGDIVDLSGGNVLTFLSICQFIWDTQKQLEETEGPQTEVKQIEDEIQAIGIFKASSYWLRKITQETGQSGDRYRLAKQIGSVLSRGLYSDQKLSYPGHNGFSLADDELDDYDQVKMLLEEMSDYGTLVMVSHTTKEKNRRSRRKMYLNPILCPQFKLHYKRLKEPLYCSPPTVEDWMRQAGIEVNSSYRPLRSIDQHQDDLPLFGDNNE